MPGTMKNMKKNTHKPQGSETPKESKALALHYMKTLVEVARESFLILDADLKIITANPIFYKTFEVSLKETTGKFIYDLGNGQWDIPELKKLLDEILPKKKTVKNYEVTHNFEKIGKKTMVLNARQIDSAQLIILAIEDVSAQKILEEKLADYTKGLEHKVTERTEQLADRIKELEALNKTMIGRELKMVELKKEIKNFKKPVKKSDRND
jgi:nitrogen-specific signal transduction histidine kinase